MKIGHPFSALSKFVACQTGRPSAFGLALLLIVVWAVTGPLFDFSDTWQLVINTGTTIVTFLMVFLIQNTQNRDTQAIHLKLDELIRVSKHARDSLIDLEDQPEQTIAAVKDELLNHVKKIETLSRD